MDIDDRFKGINKQKYDNNMTVQNASESMKKKVGFRTIKHMNYTLKFVF